MKIAVCFFGLSRSLVTTRDSIMQNVIEPCRQHGETVTLAHLYHQPHVINPRSGENAPLDPEDWRMLGLDAVSLQLAVPGRLDQIVEELKPYGDAWKNNFTSLRNLVRQLYSLSAVFSMARLYQPDVVLFCRPDLMYHHSLEPVIAAVKRIDRDHVALPDWQHWERGYNDRFSVCRGLKAAQAYGERLSVVHHYVARRKRPLHSERLLRFALARAGIPAMVFPERASRVRAGGVLAPEKFDKHPAKGLPQLYTVAAEAVDA